VPFHRPRALELIQQFLDLGPWAVDLGSFVGLWPYMVKLLDSASSRMPELFPTLMRIWAKIVAHSHSTSKSVIETKDWKRFVTYLSNKQSASLIVSVRQRFYCLLVIAVKLHKNRQHQDICFAADMDQICQDQLNILKSIRDSPQKLANEIKYEPDYEHMESELKKWVCFCLGKLWDGHFRAKVSFISCHLSVRP
jgi:regulator-associated protein of mTOR